MKDDRPAQDQLYFDFLKKYDILDKVQQRGASVLYIGIDPGAQGAIGFVFEKHCYVLDLPVFKIERKRPGGKTGHKSEFDLSCICDIFHELNPIDRHVQIHVGLEIAQIQVAGPGKGGAYTAYRVGVGFGMWPLFLREKGYSVEEVNPQTWKASMKLRGLDKEAARKKAMSLFPTASLSRKQDHNRAEALLLAEYARRLKEGDK